MSDEVKFTPKHIDTNYNVSTKNPLIDFIQLTFGLVCVFIIGYFALGVATEYIAENYHKKINKLLSKSPNIFLHATGSKSEDTDSEGYRRLNKVFQKILVSNNLDTDKYKLHLVASDDVNAYAAPGGHIFLLRGFLDSVDSENELAFVLSHELAHHENKDAVKGLGRGLALLFVSTILTGSDSSISSFTSGFVNLANSKYSKAQEIAADKVGLRYLNNAYSHVGGAKDFFSKMASKEGLIEKYSMFSTHPRSIDRIKKIDKEIKNNSYRSQPKTNWLKQTD